MKILFVTATRVGDAVLSTGLLDRLIRQNPTARFTIACGPAAAGLFEAVPNLDRVIVLDKMPFSLHWVRLWTMTVGHVWDVVVDLRNAPLTWLLPAKRQRRMGSSREMIHRVRRLARVMGWEADPPAPRLWTLPHHDVVAKRWMPDGVPVLAVGPTANWRAKTWRVENFMELIERLTGPSGILPGARVAVFGRDDERPQAMRLIESIPAARRIDLVGRVDLLTLFACLKRAHLYVGNDSGLMHMAAAAGTPTLGLFGPSQEEHYAPWGPLTAVARAKLGFGEIFPPGIDHRDLDSLMDSLTVDMAETAARDLWRRAREAAA